MQNAILMAVIVGLLAGCAGTPMSEEEYAEIINSDRRVWPPYQPGQAIPPQIMDDESNSGRDVRDRRDGRDGRDGRGGRGGRR